MADDDHGGRRVLIGMVPIEVEYEDGVPVKFSIDLRGLMPIAIDGAIDNKDGRDNGL